MNISYELAKELKDAGFPQGEPNSFVGLQSFADGNDDGMAFVPTLSELIEVCGEDFWKLEKYQDRWQAFDAEVQNEVSTWVVQGFTPEEAVAHLWLALNKTNA